MQGHDPLPESRRVRGSGSRHDDTFRSKSSGVHQTGVTPTPTPTPYYLWVNASWSSFVAKWRELSGRNLRLVDLEITRIGDQDRYSGVWRQGSDAHYLWVNADWANFVAKWRELAERNLRLTRIVRRRVGSEWRYSGVWRAGSDAYYLWANVSWPSFVEKWRELGNRNLRLVDFEISTSAGGSPLAPGDITETMMTEIHAEAPADGFGGGRLVPESAPGTAHQGFSAEGTGGGGDLGDGFMAAGPIAEPGPTAVLVPGEGSDGYGGGDLVALAAAVGGVAVHVPGDIAESDDGTGHGGGTGGEPAVAETGEGAGFGGGVLV